MNGLLVKCKRQILLYKSLQDDDTTSAKELIINLVNYNNYTRNIPLHFYVFPGNYCKNKIP